MAIAPYRYRVEGDVYSRILNRLVRHASDALSAHLRYEFTLEFRRKVTAHRELRIVILENLTRDYGIIWNEEDKSLLELAI